MSHEIVWIKGRIGFKVADQWQVTLRFRWFVQKCFAQMSTASFTYDEEISAEGPNETMYD